MSQPRARKGIVQQLGATNSPRTPAKTSTVVPLPDDDLVEKTPRAPQQQQTAIPPKPIFVPPSGPASSVDDDDRSSQQTRETGETNESKKRKRNGSPDKMASQRFMVEPVVTRPIDLTSSTSPMSLQLQSLLRPVFDYSMNCGFMHTEMQHLKSPIWGRQHDRLWDIALDPGRARTGSPVSLEAVQRIHEQAQKMQARGDAEAGWTAQVYVPLIQLALDSSHHKDTVDQAVITTARVQPSSLLPQNTKDKAASSKLVDLGIVLETDCADQLGGNRSLTQTFFPPLRNRILAISIEVKTTSGDLDTAEVQVSRWAFAGLKKFKSDMIAQQTREEIPPLPLLVVYQHTWTLYAATLHENQLHFWSNISFGSTQTVAGIYQIIATLHWLIHWSETTLRPWFNRNILGMRDVEEDVHVDVGTPAAEGAAGN